jgi:hypothetical protein
MTTSIEWDSNDMPEDGTKEEGVIYSERSIHTSPK